MDSALVAPQMHAWALRSKARIGELHAPVRTSRRRKLLLVHLDGIPRAVIERVVREDRMPFLSRLVRNGIYHLDSAFWGSPASTPAFQASVLYGVRHPNLPAYHWFDRELGRVVRMNVPRDALSIERRIAGASNGGSLLEDGGTTYLSLFRADASNQLAMTSLANLSVMLPDLLSQMRGLRALRRRTGLGYIGNLLHETWQAGLDAFRWIRRIGDHRHEVQFMLNRFFVVSLGWGLARKRALIDMVRGVPAIYLVFGNFDEVAHRRGPFSHQAARELFQADRALEELYTMAKTVDEPYDMFLVTDHGHVDSAPFEQRTGRKLAEYLLEPEPAPLPEGMARALGDGRALPDSPMAVLEEPVVIEAGNFSHVYLTRSQEPLDALEILARHRGLLARAVNSPEIGIVALRRGDSAVAIIGGGVYGPDEIDRSPLASAFSRHAVADLLEELPYMPTAGDLVLYGEATRAGGTVGFAWEFGSHGGLTRTETDSVVMWPADVSIDLRGLNHATQLHQRLSEVYRN
jgi:Type I phosphodiesterase / nucleotide pyrophosphatase